MLFKHRNRSKKTLLGNLHQRLSQEQIKSADSHSHFESLDTLVTVELCLGDLEAVDQHSQELLDAVSIAGGCKDGG
jgi:hypothetical protein